MTERAGMRGLQLARQPATAAQFVNLGDANKAGTFGVIETDFDPVNRRIGIKRQPGGTGFGDAQLHDQQVDTTRQPEANDLAGTHAISNQARGNAVGSRIQFAISQLAISKK